MTEMLGQLWPHADRSASESNSAYCVAWLFALLLGPTQQLPSHSQVHASYG